MKKGFWILLLLFNIEDVDESFASIYSNMRGIWFVLENGLKGRVCFLFRRDSVCDSDASLPLPTSQEELNNIMFRALSTIVRLALSDVRSAVGISDAFL